MVLLSTHSIFPTKNCVKGKKNHLSDMVLFNSDNLLIFDKNEGKQFVNPQEEVSPWSKQESTVFVYKLL